MNAKTSNLRLLMMVFIAIAGQFAVGATEVYFSATIDQSPFATPGYTAGSIVTGQFDYMAGTAPFAKGPNYTEYYISDMHVFFGAAQYNAGLTKVEADHDIGIGQLPPYLDVYDVTGYSLTGPTVEGHQPAYADLQLVDNDASIYAGSTPPYPVDLPNPGLFESKTLTVVFNQSASVQCTVQSIAVVPEPGSLALVAVMAWASGQIFHKHRKHMRSA